MNKNFTEDNYLVFFSDEKFYVYKVSVHDTAIIEDEMVYRFSLITRAMENGDIGENGIISPLIKLKYGGPSLSFMDSVIISEEIAGNINIFESM